MVDYISQTAQVIIIIIIIIKNECYSNIIVDRLQGCIFQGYRVIVTTEHEYRIRSIKRRHFQWPRVTPSPVRYFTPLT